jgi:hypothetical protein
MSRWHPRHGRAGAESQSGERSRRLQSVAKVATPRKVFGTQRRRIAQVRKFSEQIWGILVKVNKIRINRTHAHYVDLWDWRGPVRTPRRGLEWLGSPSEGSGLGRHAFGGAVVPRTRKEGPCEAISTYQRSRSAARYRHAGGSWLRRSRNRTGRQACVGGARVRIYAELSDRVVPGQQQQRRGLHRRMQLRHL